MKSHVSREAARPLTADAIVKARPPSGGAKKLKPGGSGGAHHTSRLVASASQPAQVFGFSKLLSLPR